MIHFLNILTKSQPVNMKIREDRNDNTKQMPRKIVADATILFSIQPI